MALFRKKCAACKKKISKGSEVFAEVKDPVYSGKVKKAFCSSACVEEYEASSKKSCCSSGCCG